MAETIRDVVVKVAIQQADVKLNPPDPTPVAKAAEKAESSMTEAARSADESWQQAAASVGDVQTSIDDANSELEKFSSESLDSALDASEKFKGAAEGAFTLARGIAFVGTSSEENFKEVVERLAAVQGAFDIFKGGSELILGTVESLRALKTATGAATVGQAALSAANSTVAATAGAASTAMTALKTALGPVGLAVTAVTAVTGGLVAAWHFFTSGEAEEGADDAAEGVRGLRDEMEETVPVAERVKQALDLGDVGESFVARQRELQKMRQELEGQAGIKEKILNFEDQLFLIEKQRLETRRSMSEAFRESEQFTTAQRALEAQGIEATQRSVLERFAEGEFGNLDAQKAAADILVDRTEDATSIAEERLDILQEQESALEKQIRQEEKSLEVAEKKLQAEQERLQSLDEIVGRLSAEERLELERLGKKVRSGEELSAEELRRLEDLGGKGTSEFVSEEFAERGRERGGASVFEPFLGEPQRGEGSREQELQRKVEEQRERVEGEGGIVDTLNEQLDETAEAQEEQLNVLRDLAEQQREFREQLQEIQDEMDRQQGNAA